MRIAIDAVGNVTGGGLAVLFRTMRALAEDERVADVVVYGSPADVLSDRIPALDRVNWSTRRDEHESLRERVRWYEAGLDHTAQQFGADVVVTMNGMGHTRMPRVAVIQQAFSLVDDVGSLEPWSFRLRQQYIRRATIKAARGADRVVVASDWMADVADERLARRPAIIPLGLPALRNVAPAAERRRVVIDARPLDYKRAEVGETIGEIVASRVPELTISRLDGTVPPALAERWLSEAVAFVSASRIESFGLGVVEAFASRCPVVAADRPWSRSTAADAALYFAPDDAAGASEYVVMLATDHALRDEVVTRGTGRLESLWDDEPYRRFVTQCEEVTR